MNNHQLRKWLMREIHNQEIPRKPPKRETRGPARSYKYRGWIRSLPSAVSGLTPCDACHTGPHGLSQKASDYTCIPLTREEHQELHAIGPEAFELRHGLDIGELVKRLNYLWFKSRTMEA